MEFKLFKKGAKPHDLIPNEMAVMAFGVLIIVLGLTACKSSQDIQLNAFVNRDPRIEGIGFIDSLKVKKIEVIFGYYAGCNDCQPYDNRPYYVLWNSKDLWCSTKFTRKNRFNTIKGVNLPVNSELTFFDAIKNEKQKSANVIKSSYHYEEVKIMLVNFELNYSIKNYEREINLGSHRIEFVDRIRTSLLNIPDEEWQELDY